MTIPVTCDSCGKAYGAPDKAAGKRFACQECGAEIRVPKARTPARKKPAQQEADPWDALDDVVEYESASASLPPVSGRSADASRKAKRRRSKKPSLAFLKPALFIVGGVALLAGVAVAGWIFLPKFLPIGDDQALAQGREALRAADPELPHGVADAPNWLMGDCPHFDVVEFFQAPAESDNAAKPYLVALAEFDESMRACFPNVEDDRFWKAVQERRERMLSLFDRWNLDSNSVSQEELSAVVNEFDSAFAALRDAQSRPQCVFQTAIGISAQLVHGQAASRVFKFGCLRIGLALLGDDIDGAIETTAVLLRLSRDLAHRGGSMLQLVSALGEALLWDSAFPALLAADALTAERCDRLLKVLEEHEDGSIDRMREASCSEYVLYRSVLHDIEHRSGEFAPAEIHQRFGLPQDRPATPGHALGFLLIESQGIGSSAGFAANFDSILETRGAQYLNNELKTLNKFTTGAFVSLGFTYWQASQSFPALDRAKTSDVTKETPLMPLLFMSLDATYQEIVRQRTRLRAMQCSVALARWQRTETNPPTDLLAVVRAAGLDSVPIDPYNDQPLKMVELQGETVIYSVGSDGEDEGAQRDSKHGEQPGDWIFRIEGE